MVSNVCKLRGVELELQEIDKLSSVTRLISILAWEIENEIDKTSPQDTPINLSAAHVQPALFIPVWQFPRYMYVCVSADRDFCSILIWLETNLSNPSQNRNLQIIGTDNCLKITASFFVFFASPLSLDCQYLLATPHSGSAVTHQMMIMSLLVSPCWCVAGWLETAGRCGRERGGDPVTRARARVPSHLMSHLHITGGERRD